MRGSLRLALIALPALVVAGSAATAETGLTQAERTQAIALGRSCQAPIIQIPAGQRDFDVYIESPFARVALVAAAALMMHQSLDAQGVRRAIKPDYRVWLVRKPGARADYAVTQVRVRSRGIDLLPTQVRNDRFFLGTVPSHGIVPALRDRQPEFTFGSLPSGAFSVLVVSTAGVQRYSVTQKERARTIRVCNEWR